MIGEALAMSAGGFLSSAHCIGMCGGFACAVGAVELPWRPVLARQLSYNAGRVFTYAFLGAVAGSIGLMISQQRLLGVTPAQGLSLLAGLLMILLGLSTLTTWRPWPRRRAGSTPFFATLFAQFLNARSLAGFAVAGLANGFLPCGLVYAFLAKAAVACDGPRAALLMACFGMGTMPAMLAVGCGSRLLTPLARKRMFRVAAVFVIGLGSLTIWRGWPGPAARCCDERQEAHVAQRG